MKDSYIGILPTLEDIEKMQKRIPEIDPTAVISMLEIMHVAEIVQRSINDVLEHEHHVSEGKLRVLVLLYQKDEWMRPSELALRIGVTKATITGLLQRLERESLLMRRPNVEDKRVNEVRLTKKGVNFIEEIMPDHYLRISNLMGRLSKDEQAKMIELARKLVKE